VIVRILARIWYYVRPFFWAVVIYAAWLLIYAAWFSSAARAR
jgi:hypothetical protein